MKAVSWSKRWEQRRRTLLKLFLPIKKRPHFIVTALFYYAIDSYLGNKYASWIVVIFGYPLL